MSNEAVSEENIDNSGRLIGMLSIAAAPGALLVSLPCFHWSHSLLPCLALPWRLRITATSASLASSPLQSVV